MKLYNPFNPHLVKLGNKFAVRKLSFFGWVYFDNQGSYWWSDKDFIGWFTFPSDELAINHYLSLRSIYQRGFNED
ncbi:MAG: hypothetical protein ACRCVX_11940 [Shewanella sp.]